MFMPEGFKLLRCAPVEPDAEDTKVLETGDEQLLVCSSVAEFLTGAVKYGHLAHPAPVPDNKRLVTLTPGNTCNAPHLLLSVLGVL